jgi:hypothetical protein
MREIVVGGSTREEQEDDGWQMMLIYKTFFVFMNRNEFLVFKVQRCVVSVHSGILKKRLKCILLEEILM